MNLPKFTAESALSKSTRTYRGSPRFGSYAQSGAAIIQPSHGEAEGLDEDEAGLEAEAGAGEESDSEEGSEEEDNGEDGGEESGEGEEGDEG